MRPFDDLTVIFDLDGTLVDSAPDLAHAMNACLRSIGRSPLPIASVRHLVGHGARALVERGLAETGGNQNVDTEALIAYFIDYYTDHIADETRPFVGGIAVLDGLLANGAKLAVCTNKLERLALPLLRQLSLDPYFKVIAGRDTFSQCKPSPLPLLECQKICGTDKAVMVGDSMTDYNAGLAAGMPVLLFAHGYWDESDPIPPDAHRFDHFSQLPLVIAAAIALGDYT